MNIKSLRETLISQLKAGSIRHIGLYTAGTMLSKGISFIALPFFTYYISEAGFGKLALITNSILLLNVFILFSTNVTLNAEYFKKKKEEYNNLFSSLFAYVIGSTVICSLLIFAFFKPLHDIFGFEWYYIFLLPLLTFFNFFVEQTNHYLRLQHKSVLFFVSNVLKALVEIGLAVVLLYFFRNDYIARVISITVSSFLFTVFGGYYFFKVMKLKGRVEFKYIRRELSFGVSILVMQMGVFLMGTSDKFFVKYFYTDNLTGIYNIASTIAAIMFIFSSSIASYIRPNMYKQLGDESVDKKAMTKKYFRKYLIAMSGAAITVFIFGTIIYFFLIKKTYLEGYWSFCILILGNFFNAICVFFFPILWYYRARKKLVFLGGIAIFSALILFFFLTKYYSILGTSIALLVSYFILSTSVHRLSMGLLKTKDGYAIGTSTDS